MLTGCSVGVCVVEGALGGGEEAEGDGGEDEEVTTECAVVRSESRRAPTRGGPRPLPAHERRRGMSAGGSDGRR